MPKEKWITKTIGGHEFEILNFDFPEVEERVLAEMDSGISVYYDTRWETTTRFSRWLSENSEAFQGREVLVIGAGVGLENLLLARVASKLHINDFAPVSVELCAEQLERNGFSNFTKQPGDFTQIPLPESAHLAIACFLIYNRDTRDAVLKFLDRFTGEVILVNEKLKAFRQFLNTCSRHFDVIFEKEATVAIRFLPSESTS